MATRRIAGRNAAERNAERTAYLGGLDAQVTEEVVWELMTQAGSVGANRKRNETRERCSRGSAS
eukprot:scaffold1431_cov346-Pavlova_lutheri.AAC.1